MFSCIVEILTAVVNVDHGGDAVRTEDRNGSLGGESVLESVMSILYIPFPV